MKLRNLRKYFAAATLALAALTLTFAPGVAMAEKLATKIAPISTVADIQNLQPGDTIIMSCPKCKETYATVVDASYKGFTATKNVPVHLCPTCETRIVSKGWGKSAKDVLVHVCSTCGSTKVSCCVMKKGETATQGMEEKK